MKKVLKFVFIIALIGACVAGTCFVFFKLFKIDKVVEVNFVQLTGSNENAIFSKKVQFIDKCVKVESGSDTRFELLLNVDNDLDEFLSVLGTYYAEEDFKFKDKDVSSEYKELEKSKALVNNIIAEYAKKCSTMDIDVVINKNFEEIEFTIFPKDVGANDLYVAMAEYMVNYAEFVNVVNNKTMSKVEKSSEDAKFYFIDAYTNATIRTFSNLNKDVVLTTAKDTKNVEYISSICGNKKFNLVEKSFEIDSINFIENYSKCDKNEFCDKLSVKVNSTTPTSSATEKALYYFNAIYGV